MTPEQRRKQIHSLVILLLLPFFMIGMAGAVYWMNLHGITLFGNEPRSRGELLPTPYPSIASVPVTVLRGEEPIRPPGERSWSFLQVGSAHCDDTCQHALWESRQTRLALGRLADRVRRVYIVLDTGPDADFQALITKEHPDLSVWRIARSDWESLMGVEQQPVKLYFMDRLGYIFMRYRNHHDYKDITKDMSFLIRSN